MTASSSSERSDRFYKRLHHILREGDDVRKTAANVLKVEWLAVDDWVERCVLED